MSSILGDKSPALPSAARPWSLHTATAHVHTHREGVCHTLSLRQAHTLVCRNVPQRMLFKRGDHCEVRTASWKGMVRRNEGLLLSTGATTFIVISVSPRDTEDMRRIPHMSNNQSLEPAHSYFHPLFLSPLTQC